MRKARRLTLVLAAVAALLSLPGCAGSAPRPQTPETAQPPTKTLAERALSRVEDLTGPLGAGESDTEGDAASRQSVPIAGSELVHGLATVTVNAPIERVREAVLGFKHYAEFMPHYRASRLLGRTMSGGRDVYMEIEALHGAMKMWARIEVAKPVMVHDVETYVTTFIDGNVKNFQANWRMKKLADDQTSLSLEVFLDPSITLPVELQNDENIDGAARGVEAMRDRIERK
jgi:ribosome-associated toxin RatA of RatAB toxin-antitoxin module